MNKFFRNRGFSKLALIAAMTMAAASISAQEDASVPSPAKGSGSVPALQQPVNSNWINGTGEHVWMNGTGESCWRSADWSPETANKGCDGALVEAPPPAPPPAPAPIPPITGEKVTYPAEIRFDFDKVVLTPEAKARLDELITKIKGIDDIEVIVVTGHTDQIGADTYNFSLSRRRAEAVKAYLVSNDIDENHVYTEGKGKTNPIVTDCTKRLKKRGKKNIRSALINCMAPNRRVEIEAVGTINQPQPHTQSNDAAF